ncbi:MAG: FHA domain-containing protein [Burkholderiales bacterium]|nr:FHA domain-containing protein [Anaerolineae bacterium]
MAMINEVQEIFREYVRMREGSLDSKSALRTLKPYIEMLREAQREQLANFIREWEGEDAPHEQPAPNSAPTRPKRPKEMESMPTMRGVHGETIPNDGVSGEVEWIQCPYCGKSNQRHEVFCYSCGNMLEVVKGEYETRELEDHVNLPDEDYFGPESVLVLKVRKSQHTYEIRPQRRTNEIVIGRSTGTAMMPDIDLAGEEASEQGVSRLHVAIRYNAKHHSVNLTDLGSVNGSYINGQRLRPQEVRALRNGDELRLGKLVVQVYFRHPSTGSLER